MRRSTTVGLAAGLVVAAGVGGGLVVRERAERERDRAQAQDVAREFLQAWPAGDYARMTALTDGGDDPGSAYERTDRRLRVERVVVEPGELSADGRSVPFTARAALRGVGELAYASTVDVVEGEAGWRVAFRSATLHPALGNGEQLQLRSRSGGRGVLTDRRGRPLRPASADLAANVLGTPGRTGLERVLDGTLTGRGAGAVVVANASTQRELRVVQQFPARPARDARTTLDLDVQRAAEAALTGLPSRSALVAVDTRSGDLLAVANRPVAGTVAAFSSYAPGSVFKVVTATALLQAGRTPATPVDCPPTTSSGGRSFRNDPGTVPGRMTLGRAMAVSCNTAILELAEDLPPGAVERAAALYGFGRADLLPIAAEGGAVPPPRSAAERAEDVLGQGRVQASPLLLAGMVAAVGDGTWRRPRLLPDGPQETRPLPPGVVAPLRGMLREVVARGTGRAAQGPGGPVSGKTGTAQYGTGDPLPTHAWFAGWRGTTAFCVFVETGVSGGRTAAPAARRFLEALPGTAAP